MNSTDFKAVFFLIFSSLVLLGAYVFAKWEHDLFVGITVLALGLFLLNLFSKAVAKG
jgi:hypothetical protein